MPQKKLTVETYSDKLGEGGKRVLLLRYVMHDYASLDEALQKAVKRAGMDGRRVQSANFRVGKDGQTTDAIVVYVKER